MNINHEGVTLDQNCGAFEVENNFPQVESKKVKIKEDASKCRMPIDLDKMLRGGYSRQDQK